MIAYKFLAPGAISPFTRFRWPAPGTWVFAPSDREDAGVHACRPADLPYWLDEELWRVELDDAAHDRLHHVVAPAARLVGRIEGWEPGFRREFAGACTLRARDAALPHLAPALRDALGATDDLDDMSEELARARDPSHAAGYLSDIVFNALRVHAAAASYVAAVLVSSVGGGLEAFEAERAWQARWLAGGLGLRA